MKQMKRLKTLLSAALILCMAVLIPANALAVEADETFSEEDVVTQDSTEAVLEDTEQETIQPETEAETAVETEADTEQETMQPETEQETEAVTESTVDENIEAYAEGQTEETPTVKYHTHVQTFGWEQDWRENGEASGTVGLSKRLEGIEIKVENTSLSGDIEYMTHVQSFGWEKDWAKNGAMSGTEGLRKRLEGIKIRLTGELGEAYDVYYRVHAQSIGWLDWTKNGEEAGTSGLSRRLEGIEIKLVKKGEAAPGETARPFVSKPVISFTSHMQTYGDQPWVGNGATSGVIGKSKRMEGFAVQVENNGHSGSIEYRAHAQTYGWLDWVSDGAYCGTVGESKRLEALQIRLTGDLAKTCDIYYRVHVQSAGWLGWAKNGQQAGTEGLGLRVEAIQIAIGGKGTLPYQDGNSFIVYTGPGYYRLGNNRYYYSGRAKRNAGTGWTRIDGERYYLVDGKVLTGWQYIGNMKYYFYDDGRLCQNLDAAGIITSGPYQIKVNKQANCVTIYAQDGANGYIIPVKAMLCSTGDDTPLGTRPTLAKYRWQAMYNGTVAQFATRLTPAPGVLFHSVTYSTTNNRAMISVGYNGMGVVRSSGCIRLFCGEAYWLYMKCEVGTMVTVYNDSNPGPVDRPTFTPIPENQTWDPTDPTL